MAGRGIPKVAHAEDYDSDESQVTFEARRRESKVSGPPRAIDRYRSRRLRDGASDSGYSSLSSGSQHQTQYYPEGMTTQYSISVPGVAPVALPPPTPRTPNVSTKPKPVIHRSSSQRRKDKPPEIPVWACGDLNCQHATCSRVRSQQAQQAPSYPAQYQYQKSLPAATCDKCGGPKHFARDCQAQVPKCYACGKLGHIARDCRSPTGGLLDLEGQVCYLCGQSGHIARDCPIPILQSEAAPTAPYQYAQVPPSPPPRNAPVLGFQPNPRPRSTSPPARPASIHGYSVPSPYAGVGANHGPPPSASAYQNEQYLSWVQAYQQQQQMQEQLQAQQALQQRPSYGAFPPPPAFYPIPDDYAVYSPRNDSSGFEAAMQRRPSLSHHRPYPVPIQPRPPSFAGAYPRDEVEESSEGSWESSASECSEEDQRYHRYRASDSRLLSSSSDRRPSIKRYHPTAPPVPTRSNRDTLSRKPETETALEYISSSDNMNSDRRAPLVVERPRRDHAPSRRRPSISSTASPKPGKTDRGVIERPHELPRRDHVRSSRRPSVSTTASSGRTKATTVSSGSGLANVIVERNGRHVTYFSKRDRDALEYARQQMDDRKLQDEVRAYQDTMRGTAPLPELTAAKISEHGRFANSEQFAGLHPKDGPIISPKADTTEIRIGDNVIHVDPGSTIELRRGEKGESTLVIGNASGEEKILEFGAATEKSDQFQRFEVAPDPDKAHYATSDSSDQPEVDSESGIDVEPGVDVELGVDVEPAVDVEPEADADFQFDAEYLDVTSVGSNVDTYAESSSVSMSQKASSTQPTTAGTSKGGSTSGDDKSVEHMDTKADAHDAESIRTDNREVNMLNETKMKLSRYFAAELFSGIQATRSTGRTISRESIFGLPELLRQFSLLAEQRVRSSLEQRAAAFVRHRRNAIAAFFQSKCGAVSEREPQEKSGGPNYVDRMDLLWRGDRTGTADEMAEIPLDQDLASIPDLDDDDEEETSFPPDIEVGIDFLLAGEECQWLLNQFHVASQTMTTGDTFMKIRRSLTEQLGDHRQLVFEVSWNPLTFVQQQYESVKSFDIGLVVCISGEAELAQATTCQEYIDMMWPNTGNTVISMLNQLISEGLNITTGAELDDNTSRIDKMFVSNNHLIVQSAGSRIELLELGEVLAWLGAACRASESDRVSYCTPRVVCDGSTTCSIRYEFSEVDEKNIGPNGASKCWLKIFNNPTLVEGYPIRLREQGEPGLEVPIHMAAVLGYAQFATSFNDHFLLKGPCSALLPTLQQGTTIIWHYVVNDDHEPMTYEQALGRQSNCPKIDLLCLEGSRHFVGWTPNVQILTGTRQAEYDNISYGGPFIEKSGYALSEVVIGGGYKYFNIGGTFTPGRKDYRHFQGTSGPYDLQIRLAGRYNVVLYDAADRRGWLLDGTSFVLHLARAALSHPLGHFAEDSADRLVEQFVHLDQHPIEGRRITAKEVLLNPVNRQIAMFQDQRLSDPSQDSGNASTWRFEDLVVYYCNILDKIREHQIKLQQSHQWKVQNPILTPKAIEGFGFLDILQMEPDLRPRAVKLTSSASYWLKMTEKAGAINILGSNFGDLLRPSRQRCQYQSQVPCGVDFLAAPVGLLKQIAMKRCGISAGAYQLADGVAWNKPSASFATTGCLCSNNQKIYGCKATSKPGLCNVHVTEIGPSKPALHQSESRREIGVDIDYSAGAIILGRKCDLPKSRMSLHYGTRSMYLDAESSPDADKYSQDSGIDVNSIGRSSTS